MIIVGIDLSGPANHDETCISWFRENQPVLSYQDHISGASDKNIVQTISDLASSKDICVGIDAPLSYNDEGGTQSQK